MTPSLMHQGYTHKKFNCGYSHKKLGRRFRQREQINNENITSEQTETNNRSKNLFRPYALDEKITPRKRKASSSSGSVEEYDVNPALGTPATTSAAFHLQDQQQSQQQNALNIATNATTTSCPTGSTLEYFGSYFALSPNSHNIRLQRQRAALYNYYKGQVEPQHSAATLQTVTGYPMSYPNVTAPIFNGF